MCIRDSDRGRRCRFAGRQAADGSAPRCSRCAGGDDGPVAVSAAPQASHRIAGGELLTAAARTLELVMQVAAACQGGMSAREGEIEFLAHVIVEAGGHARLRPVVIDQAGDVRMRLLAHYDQAEQILSLIHI